MIPIHSILTGLKSRRHDLCRLMLCNGRRSGDDWVARWTDGKEIRIKLDGPGTGIWFVEDSDQVRTGDLLDLVANYIRADDIAAIDWAEKYLEEDDEPELPELAAYRQATIELFNPTDPSRLGITLPWTKTRDKIRLRPSELSLWTGINGHGKSVLLGQVMLEAMAQGHKVCIASMEMRPEITLMRMFRQATGRALLSEGEINELIDSYGSKMRVFNILSNVTIDRLINGMKYAINEYDARYFVIDSLVKCGLGEEDWSAQKDFVDALTNFKNEYDIHICLVAHSRKGRNEEQVPGKMDIKGSGAITDLADSVFSIWRNKEKEESFQQERQTSRDRKKLNQCDSVLFCNKQRNGDWEGSVGLWYHMPSYQFIEREDTPPMKYFTFEGEAR